MEAYNPATDTWSTKSNQGFTARNDLTGAVLNGIVYAIGGVVGGNPVSTVEAYTPASDTWSTKAPMPTARGYPTIAVVSGIIYAIGGYGGSSVSKVSLSMVEAYDPTTDTWSTIASMPTARYSLAATEENGVVYAIGGQSIPDSPLATVEAYTPPAATATLAPGALDPTFGNGEGFVVHNIPSSPQDYGNDVTIDQTGKIVVVGTTSFTAGDMAIWRYDPDGTLDTTFTGTGYVSHNNAGGGNGTDYGYGVTIDAGGKILVTGVSVGAAGDMAIWRYNTDGTLDSTFGGVGYVVHNNAAGGNGTDTGYDIAVDGFGRIVVAGRSDGFDSDMALWRYNSNGTLDTGFGTGGYVVHHNAAGGSGTDRGYALVLDTQDRILVAGDSTGSSTSEMTVWRLNQNGTFDTSFGSTGYVSFEPGFGRGIIIDQNAKIIVVGSSPGSAHDMTIWRINEDGSLDTTFDGDGIITTRNAVGDGGYDYGMAVTLDSFGRILVSGFSGAGIDNYDMVVWRYNPDGTLDKTFGGTGFLTHSNAAGGNGEDRGNGITVTSTGRIIIAGYSTYANIEGWSEISTAIWRIIP